MSAEPAWDDAKYAFFFDANPDILWDAWEAKALTLPEGWTLNGTEISGAAGHVAIFRCDGFPNAVDADALRLSLNILQELGEADIAACDLKPGDCLDLEGDQFADVRDEPDAPSELEYELAVVEGIEKDGDGIIVYTDKVNFRCPPDHKMHRDKVDFKARVALLEM